MEFTIRPARPGDGAGINELRRMPGVFENILGIPSEHVQHNEDFIAKADPNRHTFVAVTQVDSQEIIIGMAGLSLGENPRVRHVGGVGLMVHAQYQSMGVGTKLMEALLDIADNWLMLVRVELTVFVDNAGAIRLYKRFGFEEEGVRRKAAIRNGRYVDEIAMGRIRDF